MKLMKPVSYFVMLSFFLTIALSSCENAKVPMDLPPAESLVIDFNAFPANDEAKKSVETIENWLYSVANIAIWNVAVGVNVALPMVAYAEAFNAEAVSLGDNSWEWAYDVTSGLTSYHVSLVGTRIDNKTFSMTMTLSNLFGSFEWFSGIVRYDHTHAEWTLNRNVEGIPTAYLTANYDRDFESDVYTTRYEVIEEANELFQDYVEFGIDEEADMDAHYTVFHNDTTTFIEWSTNTNVGRVMDERYFEDANWHCWDAQLQDVNCPAE